VTERARIDRTVPNIKEKTERGEIEIVSDFEPKMINRKGGSASFRLNSENNEVIFVVNN
jgi:hypothetical protein